MRADGLVRLGGASGMWGDSQISTPQLLGVEGLDYLVYDYLAETTMALLARARAKDARAGWATDFVTLTLARHLPRIVEAGVKVVANAGGLSPLRAAEAVESLARSLGLDVRVAAVGGDDCSGRLEALEGGPVPPAVLSANAYLGAAPIAAALDGGAQIVVTGRVVDSALVLGPLVHEHGWAWDDWDRLAAGTLAGHVIECGAQGTGGLFTDWAEVPCWEDIGYPVVECAGDGSFVVTKPPATGGLVTPGAVAEQVLYEIGDPRAYVMPDVVCDFSGVRLEGDGPERVRATGARGRPPPARCKVSVTCEDGWQVETLLAIRGIDAIEKARRTAEALLARTRRQMWEAGFGDYAETHVELLGAESHYGPHARVRDTREVVLRIAARHPEREALEFLRREAPSTGVSMAPGTRGHFGGRADIRPLVRHHGFRIAKSEVAPRVHLAGRVLEPAWLVPHSWSEDEAGPPPCPAPEAPAVAAGPRATVPLVRLAWARSGDKGDQVNVGVVARRPEHLALLRAALTEAAVAGWFAHLMCGSRVDRYEVPGLNALNFVLHDALGGGGMASLRSDPLGKSFAQMLLDMPVPAPDGLDDPTIPPTEEDA